MKKMKDIQTLTANDLINSSFSVKSSSKLAKEKNIRNLNFDQRTMRSRPIIS